MSSSKSTQSAMLKDALQAIREISDHVQHLKRKQDEMSNQMDELRTMIREGNKETLSKLGVMNDAQKTRNESK